MVIVLTRLNRHLLFDESPQKQKVTQMVIVQTRLNRQLVVLVNIGGVSFQCFFQLIEEKNDLRLPDLLCGFIENIWKKIECMYSDW